MTDAFRVKAETNCEADTKKSSKGSKPKSDAPSKQPSNDVKSSQNSNHTKPNHISGDVNIELLAEQSMDNIANVQKSTGDQLKLTQKQQVVDSISGKGNRKPEAIR